MLNSDQPGSDARPAWDDVPLENSWWVSPGRLLAGPYPGSMDPTQAQDNMRVLAEAGIDAVINLQEEQETNATGQYFAAYHAHFLKCQPSLIYLRVPIRDMGTPNDESLSWLVATIQDFLDQGRQVYIHCWGGHGRSGTVAGAWLISQGVDPKSVGKELAIRRAHSAHLRQFDCPQTVDQKRLLRKWRPQ